jgi:uncharacterized DUF497 family protein
MKFEWDEEKNRANIKKHGISFEEAKDVFSDPMRVEILDAEHSSYEERYVVIGCIREGIVIIYVAYTERGDAIRLISARKATEEERRYYASYNRS